MLCELPRLNHQSPLYVQTLKERSIVVHGPRLFNSIPKDLREYAGTLETFKAGLDRFLAGIQDKPALPQYYQSASGNGLLEQIAQQNADRFR